MPTNDSRWTLSHITVIFLAVAVLSLILVACGSEDDSASSPNNSSVGSQSNSTQDVASAPEEESAANPIVNALDSEVSADPPPPALVPATEPEAGSAQEALLALKERQIECQRSGDWQALMDTCSPELTESLTLERFKVGYEVGLNTIGVSDFSMLNMRNAIVKIYSAETAMVTVDAYDGDTPGSAGISTYYTNIDGVWYDESLLCKGLKYG